MMTWNQLVEYCNENYFIRTDVSYGGKRYCCIIAKNAIIGGWGQVTAGRFRHLNDETLYLNANFCFETAGYAPSDAEADSFYQAKKDVL